MIDVEDNPKFDGKWNNANSAAYIADLGDWLAAIRAKVGQAPTVHTRASFWDQIGNPEGFGDCLLWVAHYNVPAPHLPRGSRACPELGISTPSGDRSTICKR